MNKYLVKDIKQVDVGEEQQLTITITADLVNKFAQLTGDFNPLHVDSEFAKKTNFGQCVVHGMLGGSFVSTLIGMYLPGPGALWLSQQYEFIAPVFVGDQLKIHAKVVRKSESQSLIFLNIEAFNQRGLIIFKGESKVKLMGEQLTMSQQSLSGSKVLVTGASRGLGAAIALALAQQGAQVLVNYNKAKDKAEDLLAQAKGFPGQMQLVKADITDEKAVDELVAQTGPVDMIILNAVDQFKQAPFLEQELVDFEKGLDFGVRAPVYLLKRYLPLMVERKFGRIISILSTATIGVPPVGFSSYNVNKSALEAITKSIAVEYGKYNICANMVSPNMLRTELTSQIPERAKQLLEAQTPLKRLANLEEIAGAVVFLCSPAAAYINGHNLVLSGGATIAA